MFSSHPADSFIAAANTALPRPVRRMPAALTAIALAAVLTACGGGGGGSSGGNTDTPVTIQVQPADQSVTVSSGAVRFSLQATGTGLAYQWQRSTDGGASWSDIAGATGSALDLTNVAADQDGHQFRAKVSGTLGTVTSAAVTMHVSLTVVAPSFTADLANPADITVGGNVTLNVTAAGTNLTYLWQSSTDGGATWADVAGNNAASLLLQAVPLTANGTRYRVKISNSAGTATSKTATLTVTAASAILAITTQPQAVSVTAPNPATFTVAGSGNPTPTVQWQLSTDGGANYADISGATAATYSTGATSLSQNNYRYRAVLTNSAGAVTSSAVALSVQAATVAPTITTAPANATVTAGATATFTVAASGTPTPTIQWQVSTDSGGTWSNITGATTASYTTAALTTDDTGKRYRVVVTNSAGSATSTAATLTVNAAALLTLNPDRPHTISAGSYQSLAIDSSGRVLRWGTPITTTPEIPGTPLSGTYAEIVGGISKTPVSIKAGRSYGGQVILSDGTVEGWGIRQGGWAGSNDTSIQYALPTAPVNYGSQVRSLGPLTEQIATAVSGTGQILVTRKTTDHSYSTNISTSLPGALTGIPTISRLNDGPLSYAITPIGTVLELHQVSMPGNYDNNFFETTFTYTQRTDLTSIASIACSESGTSINFCVGLKGNGTAVAWGWNNYGQLGRGSTSSPIDIADNVINVSNIVQISVGNSNAMALASDGTVWRWGGWEKNYLTPQQITGLPSIKEISCGFSHCLMKAVDGSIYGLGLNSAGELGEITATQGTINLLVPTKAKGINLN